VYLLQQLRSPARQWLCTFLQHHKPNARCALRAGQRQALNLQHVNLPAFLLVVILQADSLWYAPDGSPSTSDKLLIQRLEVEAQLVARQGRGSSASCGGAPELPPLDLPAAAAAAGDGARLSQVPPAFLCPISMQVCGGVCVVLRKVVLRTADGACAC
jgi:hypothetical protein